MELKGRLGLLADKTPECEVLCDIGTDHAYLPIALKERNKCKRAIAADVKKGPIQAAKKNIEAYGMKGAIEARMGYGLEPIVPGEVQVVIIAGMGGILIKEILEQGLETAKSAETLVLQPMNAFEVLREWLYGNGFEIFDEELAGEGDKIYHVLCARWTGRKQELDPFYYHIGIQLIKKRDPLLSTYIAKRMTLLKKAIREMEAAQETADTERKKYLWLLERMAGVLEELKHPKI